MITQLTGKIVFDTKNYLVLDVNGVGYKIFVSEETIRLTIKTDKTTLWTHLAVRENALDLYGFIEKEEMDFFELLISISGIGPKSAMGILNVAPIQTLKSAISSGDTSYLTKVSGIGAKNAQKIVLELKGKVETTEGGNEQEEIDIFEALKSLGYSTREISEALKKISKETIGTSTKVREVLKILGK